MKKIIGILVCMLLIATAIPAIGIIDDNKNQGETIQLQMPDLDCSGNLDWVDVNPGDTVLGSFTIENVGELGSLLNWEIISWPNWMDIYPNYDLFDPSQGTGLPPGTDIIVDVNFKAPPDHCTTYTGRVVIVNTDYSYDECSIEVELRTPFVQPQWYQTVPRFLQNNPNLFPLLQRLLAL